MKNSDKNTAFDTLFNRQYAGLCVYAESFIGDKQAAEDLVQDVFVNIWEKKAELSFDDTLNSYLYKAVQNGCIRFLRQQKVRNRYNSYLNAKITEAELVPYEWVSTQSDPVEADEIKRLYRQALEQLPEKTREIFLLSRNSEKKYSEIAELTDLSVKSVEYHISKALNVFREELKDYFILYYLLFAFFL